MRRVPAQCPECGALNVGISRVPPDEHDRSDDWVTHVVCRDCDDYAEWFG
jgi:hypothetical protein